MQFKETFKNKSLSLVRLSGRRPQHPIILDAKGGTSPISCPDGGDEEAGSLTTRIILSFFIHYISGAFKSLKTTSGASRDVTYNFKCLLLCERKRGIPDMEDCAFQGSSHFKYSSKKVPTRMRTKKCFFFFFNVSLIMFLPS